MFPEFRYREFTLHVETTDLIKNVFTVTRINLEIISCGIFVLFKNQICVFHVENHNMNYQMFNTKNIINFGMLPLSFIINRKVWLFNVIILLYMYLKLFI